MLKNVGNVIRNDNYRQRNVCKSPCSFRICKPSIPGSPLTPATKTGHSVTASEGMKARECCRLAVSQLLSNAAPSYTIASGCCVCTELQALLLLLEGHCSFSLGLSSWQITRFCQLISLQETAGSLSLRSTRKCVYADLADLQISTRKCGSADPSRSSTWNGCSSGHNV